MSKFRRRRERGLTYYNYDRLPAHKALVLGLLERFGYIVSRIDPVAEHIRLESESIDERIANGELRVDESIFLKYGTRIFEKSTALPGYPKVSDSKIIKKAYDFFLAVKDMQGGCALPELEARWQHYGRFIEKSIGDIGSIEEAITFAQSKISYEARPLATSVYFDIEVHRTRNSLLEDFPEFEKYIDRLSESPVMGAATLRYGDKKLLSPDLYRHNRPVFALQKFCKDVNVAAEIGPGYGAAGYAWLTNPIRPVKLYVAIDLPVSLFFSCVFLAANFGPDAVYTVTSDEPLTMEKLSGARVVLCPPQFVDTLVGLPIDTLTNWGSMQEMTDAWVQFYSRFIERSSCRYFYSMNYFGQPVDNLAEGASLLAPIFGKDWVSRFTSINPRCLGYGVTRSFLEIVAEHNPAAAAATYSASPAPAVRDVLRGRSFDLGLFYECFEIYWKTGKVEFGLDVLKTWESRSKGDPAAHTIEWYPKEMLAIARRIREEATAISDEDSRFLNGLVDRLERLFADGIKGHI